MGRKPKAKTYGVSKKTQNVVKALAKRVNIVAMSIDKKRFDVARAGTIDYNGSFDYLSGLTTGTGFTDRSGDVVMPTYWKIKFNIVSNPSAPQTSVRTIFFQDMSNTGTSPVITEILTTSGTSAGIVSPFVFQNVSRFRILYDRTHNFSIGANENVYFDVNIPRKRLKLIHYATGVTGLKGALYCLNISNLATNLPTVNFISQLNFTG